MMGVEWGWKQVMGCGQCSWGASSLKRRHLSRDPVGEEEACMGGWVRASCVQGTERLPVWLWLVRLQVHDPVRL